MMVVAAVVAARPLALEILSGPPAETSLVASPEVPAPPLRVAVRPASEALPQLFTAKVDLETVETPSGDTDRSPRAARSDRPSLANTPWVARLRALLTVSPVDPESPPLSSRTLVALSNDPTALLSHQAP